MLIPLGTRLCTCLGRITSICLCRSPYSTHSVLPGQIRVFMRKQFLREREQSSSCVYVCASVTACFCGTSLAICQTDLDKPFDLSRHRFHKLHKLHAHIHTNTASSTRLAFGVRIMMRRMTVMATTVTRSIWTTMTATGFDGYIGGSKSSSPTCG